MTAPESQRVPVTAPQPRALGGITVRAPHVRVVNDKGVAAIARGADPLRARSETYTSVPAAAVVVYRIESGQHRQTGVLVEVSVQDYRQGRIRRHEATQPDRERELADTAGTAGVQRMPVTLLHPRRDRLRDLVTELSADAPHTRVTTPEGVTHSVWVCADDGAARTVRDELAELDALYIADGHHRMAAALRLAEQGHDDGGFTAAAVFPEDEMRVLSYHRCVPSTAPAADVLEALGAATATVRLEECPPGDPAGPAPGVVVVHVDGRSYRLRLRTPAVSDDVRSCLDVVRVDECLMPAIRAVTGYDGVAAGARGAGAECWCDSHPAIRVVPHPPTVDQVMAVADAGLTMPAKSTWFDPKASERVFLRELGE